MSANISDTAWNDLNQNGLEDINEPVLTGWIIDLDQNQNGQLDSGEASTVTDSNGEYRFIELKADTYFVTEQLREG